MWARGEVLVLGPMAPSRLERAGLTLPTGVDHRDGEQALEEWVAAVTRPGDLVVVPIHDHSIQPTTVRVYRSGRSVLAVKQNPEVAIAASVAPMTLPLGQTLGG